MIQLLERSRRAARLLLPLALVAACSTGGDSSKSNRDSASGDVGAPWSPANLTAVNGVPIAALRSAVAARLDGKRPDAISDDAWEHTRRLYKRFGQTPLWLVEDGLAKDRAGALTNTALHASDDGLRIDDYPIADLANALTALRRNPKPTAEQYADADVLLTATYAALGEDYLIGQVDPKSVSQSWHINPEGDNLDSALVRTLTKLPLDKSIAAMRPQDPDYAGLQKELAHYRDIVNKGGFPKVPDGKALKRGDRDAAGRLAALRARLAAEGIDVPADSGGAVYGAGLAAGVAQFQARHGIAVDSALGSETVNAMNVPAAYRLGQIAANLERHRWLPRSLGTRYILVNVPAFQLTAYDKGQKALDMKVIVGEEYEDKATPVFADSMETVVFRPYWNITPDIQAKETEPKIAADPGYMARNNLEYFTDGGERRIRQKPGAENSLGLVKFLFPNDFNIYLHDTPEKELFDKDVRAFSHGCIRVQQPLQLASWVLGWDESRVREAEQGKDNNWVKLPHKIPVYIDYATAYVKDGQLYFGNDLYHRDDQLVKALAEGALPSPRAVQALEALKRIATG
ncbi:MAG TPA: L,D-transpeptidase family protein [Gemmatimonadaceae bacterium]|nr:L,D-transpeptidase family protein [Gemmatimonadaceae bacterium]